MNRTVKNNQKHKKKPKTDKHKKKTNRKQKNKHVFMLEFFMILFFYSQTQIKMAAFHPEAN